MSRATTSNVASSHVAHSVRGITIVAMLIAAMSACSGGDSAAPSVPTGAIADGDGVTGVAGDQSSINPAVKVTSSSGAAMVGTTVTFAVTGGGGSATGTTQVTDGNGLARVGGWTLGPLVGPNTMAATVAGATGSPLLFTVTARAGVASAMTKVAGDAQTVVAGASLGVRPSVRVVDRNGNVVSGATVTFSSGQSSGSVSGGTVTTGADGVATVGSWIPGTTAGAQTLIATVAGVSTSPTFTLTVTVGAAALITKQAGDAQTATVATSVAVPPSVKVTDAVGNPITGQTVAFSVASGAGVVVGGSAITNAAGIATAGSWALGTAAGAQTLQATATGIATPVVFTATATAGTATQFVKQGGDAQTATVATLLLVSPSVKVSDAFGNAVVGRAVTFALSTGGGALVGANPQTNALGVATLGGWTLGTIAGAQSITAATAGIATSLAFTATAIPGPAAQLSRVSGDFQVATVNSQLPINPSVRLSDQFGNIISGRGVAFTIVTGGGTLLGPSQLTTNGVATVGGWILGSTVGTQTMQVTVDALSVLFSATGTAMLDVTPYVGTYTGTWVNTTFGSTGTGTVVIGNNAVTRTATVTASATGSVLGSGGGVAPTTRVGAYGANSVSFTGDVTPMGTITSSMGVAGNIVASGVNIPNAAISRWDASGTITATQILLNFTVTFVSGGPASGTITLTKP